MPDALALVEPIGPTVGFLLLQQFSYFLLSNPHCCSNSVFVSFLCSRRCCIDKVNKIILYVELNRKSNKIFLISSIGYKISNIGHKIFDILIKISYIAIKISYMLYKISELTYNISNMLYNISSMLYKISYI